MTQVTKGVESVSPEKIVFPPLSVNRDISYDLVYVSIIFANLRIKIRIELAHTVLIYLC